MADIPAEQLIQTAQGTQSPAEFFGVTEIAPPASNVTTVPAPVETTDEEKLLLAGFREVPSADEGALAGFKEADPLDTFSDEQLIKDKNFQPVAYFNASGEGAMDTKKLDRLKKIFNARLQEGVSGGGLVGAAGRTVKGVVEGVPHMVRGLGEFAERVVRVPIGMAAGAVSEFLPGADERREVIGNWIDTGLAEIAGGLEAEATGLSEAIKTGLDKAAARYAAGRPEMVGAVAGAGFPKGLIQPSPVKLTDEEAGQILMDWAARTKQVEATQRGEGATFNVAGQEGTEISPEAIQHIAAGGPLSLIAIGGTFKLVTEVGKVLITAPTRTAAMQAFRAAQQSVTTAQQAVKAAPTAAKEATLQSAITAAEATPKPLLASAAELVPSVETVGGRAIQATGAATQAAAATAKLGARALRATRPLGIPIGSIFGVPLQAGAEVVGRGGAALRRLGAEVASEAPGVAAQRVQDIIRATRNVGVGTGIGAAIDTGFAVGTSKTDEEARNMPGIGGALGLLGGGIRGAREIIVGEQLAPRRGALPDVESKAYGENNTLDSLHEQATAKMSPEARNAVNLVRETSRKLGGRVYVMPDEASFRKVLDDAWSAQNGGQPVPPEVSASHARAAEQNGMFTSQILGPDGKPQNVAFVRDPAALVHEGLGHVLDRVLPDEINAEMDAAVRDGISPENWEAAGNYYVERFTGQKSPDWRQTLREAGVDIDPDIYLAREMRAENLDVAFRNRGEAFATSPDLYHLVTQWAGVLAEKAGIDFGGRSQELQTPAAISEVRRGERAVRGLIESEPRQTLIEARDARLRGAAKPSVSPERPVSPTAETPSQPPITTPSPEVQKAKDWIIENPQKVHTPEAGAAAVALADAITAGTPVRVTYWAAKGTPAGEAISVRPERRAEIEAQRGAANEDRQLVEHEFTPYRVETRSTGPQFVGWSRDILNANVSKFQEWVAKQTDKSRVPYETDANGLTENSLAQLREDARVYQENQANGYTGAGERIVVPEAAEKLGAFKPEEKGEPLPIPQERADVINYLFNTKIPETASRLAPLHLAGQEVSAATVPGRVEIPIRRRGEYSEATLKKAGITEPKGVREVNPFRQWVESQPGEKPSLVEVSQRLNLARMEEAHAAGAAAEPVRGNILTQAAGFQPKPLALSPVEDMAKLPGMTPEEWKTFSDGYAGKYGKGFTGWAFDLGAAAKTAADVQAFRSMHEMLTTAGREAMKAGDFNNAMSLISRGQAAREAYEVATGRTLDGKTEAGVPFIREHYDPDFQPPVPPKGLAEAAQPQARAPKNEAEQRWFEIARKVVEESHPEYLRSWGGTEAVYDAAMKKAANEKISPQSLSDALSNVNAVVSKKGWDFSTNDLDAGVWWMGSRGYARFRGGGPREADYGGAFGKRKEPPLGPQFQPRERRLGEDEAKKILALHNKSGGSTFNLVAGKSKAGTKGFAVAVYPERSKIIEGKPTEQILKDYIAENTDLLFDATNENSLGTWENEGKTYLDVVRIETSRGKAIDLAKQNDQKAIFDLKTSREIPTGGTGEVAKATPAPAAAQLPLASGTRSLAFTGESVSGIKKSWILPDGTPIQTGGEWHHEWLANNPEIAKRYNLDVPDFEGSDAGTVREDAMKKGFARVNYTTRNGTLTVEARAKDWNKIKPTIEDMVDANIDQIDNMTVTLFDDSVTKVVDSDSARLFDLTDREKMQNLPLISKSEARGESFQPKRLSGEPSERTSMKYFSGEQPNIPETGAKGHQLWDGANFLSEQNASRGRLTKTDEAAKKEISRALAEETLHALENHPDAVGWYDRKIKDTLETLSELHPEMKDDPNRAALFKALIAVTSNGQAIRENFFRADELYTNWKKTGELPTDSKWGGVSAPAINAGIKTLKVLIEEKGLEGARKFLESEFTIGELKKMGFTVPTEKVTTKVRGSNVLGPKVGAFFANLNGDFSPVTMDRWFMRTFNRVRGVLTEVDPKATVKHIGSVLAALPDTGKDFGFNVREVRKDLVKLREDMEAGKPIDYSRPAVKYVQTRFRDYTKGFTDRSAINRATKLLHEQLFPLHQHPASGGERAWVRENIAEAQKLLKEAGVDLTNADMQALLWYYEKELYAKLGFDSPRAAGADYSSAARELVDERRGLNRPAGEQLELRPRGAGVAGGGIESNPEAMGRTPESAASVEALEINPRYGRER